MTVGRPPRPPGFAAIAGYQRPDRADKIVPIFPDVITPPQLDAAPIPPPDNMSPEGKENWIRKVARYQQRGQRVLGFEDTLLQYCEIEAELNRCWAKRTMPPVSALNAYRVLAVQFFDTPASQRVAINAKKQTNPFQSNGKRTATGA